MPRRAWESVIISQKSQNYLDFLTPLNLGQRYRCSVISRCLVVPIVWLGWVHAHKAWIRCLLTEWMKTKCDSESGQVTYSSWQRTGGCWTWQFRKGLLLRKFFSVSSHIASEFAWIVYASKTSRRIFMLICIRLATCIPLATNAKELFQGLQKSDPYAPFDNWNVTF